MKQDKLITLTRAALRAMNKSPQKKAAEQKAALIKKANAVKPLRRLPEKNI